MMNSIIPANSLLIPPLGCLLNFTLLWLILHRTPKEMWPHSRVLLQTCILDILLLIVFCIAMPYPTFFDPKGINAFIIFDGYLIQFGGLFRSFFSDPIHLWYLQLLYHFLFQLDVFAISVQFVYRYLVLNRSMKITICRYLLFLTVPLICSALMAFDGHFIIKRPLLNNSKDFSNICIDFNENITFAAYELNEFPTYIVMLSVILCYFLCYSIIIFCGQQMVKYVAANAMNERLKELNKQLTKSLIIIAGFPLILQTFFGLFIITSMFIKVTNFNEGFFVYLLNSWLPIFNPLASLWTFRPYRDALIAPFKKGTIVVVPQT